MAYKALKSPNLDLHVVLEHFMTPTAMLADYVLPAASKLERGTLSTMEDFTSVFVAAERAIQPMGEPDACDQVTGSWPGRALLCRVSRVPPA